MHPIWLLLIGVLIVVGGILLFRLHAFLALILAALVVGCLTPPAPIERWTAEGEAISAEQIGADLYLELSADETRVGAQLLVLRPDEMSGRLRQEVLLQVREVNSKHAVAIALRQDADFRLGPDDLVIAPAAWTAARGAARKTVGERVAEAFGSTCGKIGILIAMAAIIGKCLLDSGAAERIVRSALRVTGERGAPAAFVGSGFLLSIPVFFDTVFYLMIPLGKALRMRTGRNYLLYVLTIIAGGTMAHSLVPPTPGPLFVAEQFGVDLGLMIGAGCLVGLVSSGCGYLYAQFMNARHDLPLRDSPDSPLKDLQAVTQRRDDELPPLALALAPILLPVVLIAGSTVLGPWQAVLPEPVFQWAMALGNKNIALALATAVAMAILVWQQRIRLRDLAGSIQAALSSGGVIILITAAGGAFGTILQQTGVAGLVRQLPTQSPLLLLVLACLITTAVRTAQGSATVAMITAAGVFSGLIESGQLGCHPVFLALAIGCGSKPIMWMNDSGFWIMCKMSGMTESEGLRYITPLSCLMGATGLLATLALASIVPG